MIRRSDDDYSAYLTCPSADTTASTGQDDGSSTSQDTAASFDITSSDSHESGWYSNMSCMKLTGCLYVFIAELIWFFFTEKIHIWFREVL